MKQCIRLLGAVAVFSALLLSCKKENASSGGNTNTGGGSTGGTTAGPLFTAVKSMMQGSCAVSGCHVAGSLAGGHDFAQDNTILAQKDRIKVRAVDQAGTPTQMPQPPRAALSAADQKKITDWITAGGRLSD